MRAGRLGLALAVGMAVSGCGSGIDINTDWDPGVDFSAYRTFAVLERVEGSQVDQLTERRIQAAITGVLEESGMRQVSNPEQADAAVGWQITTDQRSSFQTVSTGWSGHGYRWGGWYGGSMGMSTSRTTETRYEVGTLVIALFDTNREEMIFTSTGSRKLSGENFTPQEMQERINDAVREILRDWPPGGRQGQ